MTLTDEQLAAAHRATTTRQGDRTGCPSSERLVAAAVRDLDADALRDVTAHVADCAACAQELRGALQALEPPQAEATTLGGERFWRPRSTLLLAAAAVLAMFVLVPALQRSTAPAPSGLRAGALPVDPPSESRLTAPPTALAWPHQSGATTYTVEVFDGRGEPLWTREGIEAPVTDTTRIREMLPPEIREAMAQGQSFAWRVRIEGAVVRRTLGPFWFHLTPRAP